MGHRCVEDVVRLEVSHLLAMYHVLFLALGIWMKHHILAAMDVEMLKVNQ